MSRLTYAEQRVLEDSYRVEDGYGEDSYRAAPGIRVVDTDHDARWVAEHEAGHAAITLGIGWDVLSIEARPGVKGLTRSVPPADRHGVELARELAVVSAAGVASTGSQYGPGADSDRAEVRLLGGPYSFEEALHRARRVLADPWARHLRDGITEALLEHGGRLSEADLERVMPKIIRAHDGP
jgi:hypothetical protein